MNSTDGYFDVTANRTKIVTVPDGYEVRLHKIGSSEDIFPDGLSTKDIKDLNNTLVVDLSTPGTIDLKGTLLSNGQPLPTMDGVDTEIDKKITALNLSGTYATKAALTTVETTANAAAPQSTTYTKTECDNKYAPKSTTYTKTESDNKYALKTDQSITSTSDKVQICNTSQQVANASAITVVNGGLIFQTDGKVFIGVNDAWVQLGVPIS